MICPLTIDPQNFDILMQWIIILILILFIVPKFRRSFFSKLEYIASKSIEHKHSEADKITFHKISGEVTSFNKYFKTEVYSQGGGGYVGSSGGYVSPPTIYSKIVPQSDIVINTGEKLIPVTIHDDIIANVGDIINLCIISIYEEKYIGLVENQTLKLRYNRITNQVLSKIGLYTKPMNLWFLLIFIPIIFSLNYRTASTTVQAILFAVIVAFLFYLVFSKYIKRNALNKNGYHFCETKINALLNS